MTDRSPPPTSSSSTSVYNAKKALFAAFPSMHRYGRRIDRDVEEIAKDLSRLEWEGRDTSFARSTLLELRWRTNATNDVEAAKAAFSRLKQAHSDPDLLIFAES